ncbi:MAG: hydroxypyruvate isomerase [Actinobacteria bacterium]|nr:hydroxypyruvate isomerase [Actinomycetota bacterium]
MDRRDFVRAGLAAAATAASAAGGAATGRQAPGPAPSAAPRGRLRQSVCAWCFGGMPLPELCALARSAGIGSVELLDEPQWSVVRDHGLACAVANGPGGIARGWNRTEHHDALVRRSEELLPRVAAAGIPQMIVFSGNRDGLPDADGLRNCAAGLRRIMPAAEKAGVTVVMELLNSKVDHRDYMCDRTAWGVELCKAVGSDRFRLLYDVYHMQVMEGDVIRTIREHHAWIAHYHVAGNPGRGNLDGTQELLYPAICAAIADTGFAGWLAQEFLPRGDPAAALAEAVRACTV